jgi:hypothetical protein
VGKVLLMLNKVDAGFEDAVMLSENRLVDRSNSGLAQHHEKVGQGSAGGSNRMSP